MRIDKRPPATRFQDRMLVAWLVLTGSLCLVGCSRNQNTGSSDASKDTNGTPASLVAESDEGKTDADGVILSLNPVKKRAAQVELGEALFEPWSDFRMIPAKLELDPDRHFAITAPIDVVVEDVLVGTGKQVEAGAPLLQLSAPEITKYRSDFANARLRVQNRETVAAWHRKALQTVETLMQQMESSSGRITVDRMDQLEKFSQHSVFGKQGGSLVEALLRLRSAQSVTEGNQDSDVQNALPKRLLIQRETEYASAKSNFNAVAQQSLFDLQQLVAEAEADCQTAKGDLKTIEAELHHLIGVPPPNWEADTALLKPNASGEASYIYRSPRSGTVLQRHFARGERAALGETLVLVADLSKLWVVGDLRQQDWDILSLNADASLHVEVLGLERLGQIPVHLEYVGGQVEASSGAIRIAASVENHEQLLRPGMTAKLQIRQQQASRVFQVPASAIFTHNQVDYLLLQTDADQFVMRRTKLGRKNAQFVEVLDELPAGTKMMTRGVFAIASDALLETEE